MKDTIQINEHITVGPQPSEEELAQLAAQGTKSIVNLRTDGEEDQPLSPAAEGEAVRRLGLEYRHIPVSPQGMKPELVDRFRAEIAKLPAPIHVHCASGKRAGAFSMMHAAVERGATGEQTLEEAKKMGFECDQPELEQFVKSYVDQH